MDERGVEWHWYATHRGDHSHADPVVRHGEKTSSSLEEPDDSS